MKVKREDFMFWGFGLIAIYLGVAGSYNETMSWQVYHPYPWQGVAGLLLLVGVGVYSIVLPWIISARDECIIAEYEIERMRKEL